MIEPNRATGWGQQFLTWLDRFRTKVISKDDTQQYNVNGPTDSDYFFRDGFSMNFVAERTQPVGSAYYNFGANFIVEPEKVKWVDNVTYPTKSIIGVVGTAGFDDDISSDDSVDFAIGARGAVHTETGFVGTCVTARGVAGIIDHAVAASNGSITNATSFYATQIHTGDITGRSCGIELDMKDISGGGGTLYGVYQLNSNAENYFEGPMRFLDEIIASGTTAPASASSTGTAGQVAFDSNYIYYCTATDTWKRAALSTW